MSSYRFTGGYPDKKTIQRAYADADFNRALTAYRFFYPTVSIVGTWKGNLKGGVVPNKIFALLEGTPNQLVFTPNSDTPYAGLALDLGIGPIVVEFPPGPLMSSTNDLNQIWVMDAGLPGPDKGNGGRHLLVPPGWQGKAPSGYQVGRPTTNRVLMLLRALPTPGKTPNELMQSVKVYPLDRSTPWKEPKWAKLTTGDFTPLKWEDNLRFWKELHELIDSEPPYEGYRSMYGELAELGIIKGRPFAPDRRMKEILTRAAQTGNALLRVQSFADRKPERIVWKGRQWEWAVLRPENGVFEADYYTDTYARGKWLYQAQIESPAMFSREPGAGSLYWLGVRDKSGTYLNGSNSYRLKVPLPVPGKLFWSVTVYDAETRSEIKTRQSRAALRSQFELKGLEGAKSIDLYFGWKAPKGREGRWIRTIPGKGWFVYFRIYGPEAPAFDGSWKPGDFEIAKN
ncbi:MAG: DUF1254 domain-containing protein [Pseudoxanthomonas sp.]